MNKFIEVSDNKNTIGFSVEWNGKGYTYLKKIDTTVTTMGSHKKRPSDLGMTTEIGKTIKKHIETIEPDHILRTAEEITQYRNKQYYNLMQDLEEVLKQERIESEQKKADKEKEKDARYKELYSQYVNRRDSYGLTDLQFIGQISLGLGVGLHNIILKMFINHLLTISKIRPSNQIVYSKQASGKSFIIDQTLKLIPAEYVINGRTTSAFFFNEFDGEDVSGHIFNFGDLGGDNDNENTIEVRDLVKILNTDGKVERGIMIDNTPTKQVITGHPSLTYSTVDNEIINSQEKSRGSVFSPPLIDEYQLTVYNSIMNSPGVFKQTIDCINSDVESVKGFVWNLKDDLLDYELFNPYMFNVTNFLNNMDDFNRKIKEFDMTLLIVTYLNNPVVFEHSNYYGEPKKLMIASKQDVINALALFEGKDNLLPNHRECIKAISKVFKLDDSADDYYLKKEGDFDKACEEYNKYISTSTEIDEFNYADESTFKNRDKLDWDIDEGDSEVFFTISIIRKKFKGERWFSRVKDNLSDVLRTLYEYGYLLKYEKGKINNENIYCLPFDIENKLNNVKPIWGGKDLDKSIKLFKEAYPDLFNDFKDFITRDRQSNIQLSNLDLSECKIYDLVWERFNNYSDGDSDKVDPTDEILDPSAEDVDPTAENVDPNVGNPDPTEMVKMMEEMYL